MWTPATFRLAACCPTGITVAGDFVPAEGYVRLYGSGPGLRMRSEGRCLIPTCVPLARQREARSLDRRISLMRVRSRRMKVAQKWGASQGQAQRRCVEVDHAPIVLTRPNEFVRIGQWDSAK